MEKIKENLSIYLSIAAILFTGGLTIKELREHEEEKAEQRKQQEIEQKVDCHRQPMKRNSSSLQIGYLLKDAYAYTTGVGESQTIKYAIAQLPKDKGIRVFDSLVVEICKHHCDSITTYKFISPYNREFECYNGGQFLKLKYKTRASSEHAYANISIEYGIPQNQGLDEEWEWCIINGKYPTY